MNIAFLLIALVGRSPKSHPPHQIISNPQTGTFMRKFCTNARTIRHKRRKSIKIVEALSKSSKMKIHQNHPKSIKLRTDILILVADTPRSLLLPPRSDTRFKRFEIANVPKAKNFSTPNLLPSCPRPSLLQ